MRGKHLSAKPNLTCIVLGQNVPLIQRILESTNENKRVYDFEILDYVMKKNIVLIDS